MTPRRHIIPLELSREGSTAAIWGFRQVVYWEIGQMERIGADSDALQKARTYQLSVSSPQISMQRVRDQSGKDVPDDCVAYQTGRDEAVDNQVLRP